MKLAYLVSRYPAVSHTFVQREVAALRELGVEVDTFSVRAGTALSDVDRAEARTTTTLVPASPVDLIGMVATAARHPGATIRLVRHSLRASSGGARSLAWRAFYAGEAVLLWRHLRRRGITHVHAHFANVAADVAGLATELGRLLGETRTWSFTMHGPTELADVAHFGLAAKARDADFVICISDFARSQLMALLDEHEWSKLSVVHCGIDPTRFDAVVRPADRVPLSILCVGRLVPEKGQAVLLDALADLRSRGVDATVTLVGDGDSRHALESTARRLGLDDHVHFAGAVGQDDILAHYRDADVFCLPSFAEGVPVVLMEAMATELPVVSTHITGIPELITDGESGLLVRPGRADLLADALARLAADPDLRRDLGRAGRAAVLAAFDIRDVGPLLRDRFLGVAASSAEAEAAAASVSGDAAPARA